MKYIIIATIFSLAGLFGACATNQNSTAPKTNATNTVVTNQAANMTANTAAKTEDETPAAVKAAFPDAQSFTKQHKDLTQDQIADIEKDSGAKVPDTDHHSYLAFSTADGTRKQIGAATVVKADGEDFVIIYESKEGNPVIKEVRFENGISGNRESRTKNFIKQFAGKSHDDKLKLGEDLKIDSDNKLGEAIAEAVRVDVLTMQALYGAAHKH